MYIMGSLTVLLEKNISGPFEKKKFLKLFYFTNYTSHRPNVQP